MTYGEKYEQMVDALQVDVGALNEFPDDIWEELTKLQKIRERIVEVERLLHEVSNLALTQVMKQEGP